MSAPARLSREEIEREVNSVPFWWHSIEIGGVTTPGKSEPERQRRIVRTFPDLRGKSVLDVAAWDSFFSFEAERLGADRVIALDHLVWELDIAVCMAYWQECNQHGVKQSQAFTRGFIGLRS